MSRAAPGPRLLLVRPRPDLDDPLAAALREAGWDVLPLATTAFAPPLDPGPLAAARRRLEDGDAYDWALFTSPRAVAACAPSPLGRPWPGVSVAAVGAATAQALASAGQPVHLRPRTQSAAALAQVMAALGPPIAAARVLLPQGDRAKPDLGRHLAGLGARVAMVKAYRTVPVALSSADLAILDGPLDAVAYTSGSGAEALLAASDRPRVIPAVALGPRTAEDLRALGLEVAGIAPTPDATGLLEALATIRDGESWSRGGG